MPCGASPLTGSSSTRGRRGAEQRGNDAEALAHAEGEPADAFAGDVVQANEFEGGVDAPVRDARAHREGDSRRAPTSCSGPA